MHYRFADGETVKINNKNCFTHFLPRGHHEMDDLEKWRDWFSGRGINACIVEVVGKGFAVYRNGLLNTIQTEALRRKTMPKSLRMQKQKAQTGETGAPRRRGRPRKQPLIVA